MNGAESTFKLLTANYSIESVEISSKLAIRASA